MIADIDLDYLREALTAASFTSYSWDGEDRNLAAFRSKKEFIEWYCQPPGIDGQPYRDRGFYCRELAMLSRIVQPRTVVEFGTSLGIGTCLLRWLNHGSSLTTVDINTETFLPGNQRVPMGFLARLQEFECEYLTQTSWDYRLAEGVDLCFIDADHSYGSVIRDSYAACANRTVGRPWAIAWHDHNDRHLGVINAVRAFCTDVGVVLQSREDSDTVWIMGDR